MCVCDHPKCRLTLMLFCQCESKWMSFQVDESRPASWYVVAQRTDLLKLLCTAHVRVDKVDNLKWVGSSGIWRSRWWAWLKLSLRVDKADNIPNVSRRGWQQCWWSDAILPSWPKFGPKTLSVDGVVWWLRNRQISRVKTSKFVVSLTWRFYVWTSEWSSLGILFFLCEVDKVDKTLMECWSSKQKSVPNQTF